MAQLLNTNITGNLAVLGSATFARLVTPKLSFIDSNCQNLTSINIPELVNNTDLYTIVDNFGDYQHSREPENVFKIATSKSLKATPYFTIGTRCIHKNQTASANLWLTSDQTDLEFNLHVSSDKMLSNKILVGLAGWQNGNGMGSGSLGPQGLLSKSNRSVIQPFDTTEIAINTDVGSDCIPIRYVSNVCKKITSGSLSASTVNKALNTVMFPTDGTYSDNLSDKILSQYFLIVPCAKYAHYSELIYFRGLPTVEQIPGLGKSYLAPGSRTTIKFQNLAFLEIDRYFTGSSSPYMYCRVFFYYSDYEDNLTWKKLEIPNWPWTDNNISNYFTERKLSYIPIPFYDKYLSGTGRAHDGSDYLYSICKSEIQVYNATVQEFNNENALKSAINT